MVRLFHDFGAHQAPWGWFLSAMAHNGDPNLGVHRRYSGSSAVHRATWSKNQQFPTFLQVQMFQPISTFSKNKSFQSRQPRWGKEVSKESEGMADYGQTRQGTQSVYMFESNV